MRKIVLTNWQLLTVAMIISIMITSVGVFLSNLNFLRLDSLVNRTDENLETAHQFELIQLAHEKTTREVKNATKNVEDIIGAMNETQKNIAILTNDIYIMQKAELESRKTLGQFLAVVAANNNITIPDELRKRLFINNVEPEQSAPNY